MNCFKCVFVYFLAYRCGWEYGFMALCQLCHRRLHMVICVINICAFSLLVAGRLMCTCTYMYILRLRVYKSLHAYVHVIMINDSEKVPVGWDQVWQDLTLQKTLTSFPTHSINPSLCTSLCSLCRAIHLLALAVERSHVNAVFYFWPFIVHTVRFTCNSYN